MQFDTVDLFHSSHFDMKLQINKGVINKMDKVIVPVSVTKPFQWANMHESALKSPMHIFKNMVDMCEGKKQMQVKEESCQISFPSLFT